MPVASVDAALRRMDQAAGRPPRSVAASAALRGGPAPTRLDSALRWRFLAALDADLALHPQALAAAEPIRWPVIARNWWAT